MFKAMKKKVPEKYYQLVSQLRERRLSGLIGRPVIDGKDCIVMRTRYPGCRILLTIVDEAWCIELTNRDPDKISNELIKSIVTEYLEAYPADQYRINASKTIDFLEDSVCLENLRDIHQGRIDELINDNSVDYQERKIGAFGFLKGNTKPERLEFVKLSNQYPEKFRYIETQKFVENRLPDVSLLAYKRQFKYIIDLPGHTYSTKLYWMLFLKRPLFLVPPILSFAWEKHLQPWVHYIPIKPDFTDLVDHFEWAESNPDKVEDMRLALFDLAITELSPMSIMKKFSDSLESSLLEL